MEKQELIIELERIKHILKTFLEVHNQTKIPDMTDGVLKMHILHAKNNKKEKQKDKFINYLLGHLSDRIFEKAFAYEDSIVSHFLIDELCSYYRNTIQLAPKSTV